MDTEWCWGPTRNYPPGLRPCRARAPCRGGLEELGPPPCSSLQCLTLSRAPEGLFDGRGQRVIIGVKDEDGEQPCRLGLARVAADRMGSARRFGPVLSCSIDARLAVIHL